MERGFRSLVLREVILLLRGTARLWRALAPCRQPPGSHKALRPQQLDYKETRREKQIWHDLDKNSLSHIRMFVVIFNSKSLLLTLLHVRSINLSIGASLAGVCWFTQNIYFLSATMNITTLPHMTAHWPSHLPAGGESHLRRHDDSGGNRLSASISIAVVVAGKLVARAHWQFGWWLSPIKKALLTEWSRISAVKIIDLTGTVYLWGNVIVGSGVIMKNRI